MISRSNYEQYFLDFHEAALSAAELEALYAFLDEHPDLREEFESFVDVKLEPELNISFKHKSALHRSDINEKNYLTKLIAYTEGDLDAAAKLSTEEYITNNPGIERELDVLKKTRIKPDHSIVFQGKSNLKRGAKVIPIGKSFYRAAAIAASIVILLISYFVFVDTKNKTQIAVEDKPGQLIPLVQELNVSPNEVKVNERQTLPKKNIVPINRLAPSYTLNEKSSNRLQKHEHMADSSIKKLQSPVKDIKQDPNLKILLTEENRKIIPDKSGPSSTEKSISTGIDIPVNDLSSVFSQEELAELESLKSIKSENKQQSKNTGWEIAEAGVEKLAKATGANIGFETYTDHIKNATTYAVEIGKFSVSRTKVQ